jgi:hypothetical protein
VLRQVVLVGFDGVSAGRVTAAQWRQKPGLHGIDDAPCPLALQEGEGHAADGQDLVETERRVGRPGADGPDRPRRNARGCP